MEKLLKIWRTRELRNNILFVIAMLVIFRLAAHIPVPGVNTQALRDLFASNQFLGLMNLFSGGGMQNFSIVMMGVGHYITASIIFQLLGMVVPSIEEMNKEEAGRKKINMWTRWATIPLAVLQSYGMITLLRRSSYQILGSIDWLSYAAIIATITAGTIFLMWIGELITEKKVGNGISLLIFAGIIAGLPQTVQQMIATYDSSKLFMMIGFLIIAVLTVVGVIYISEGQRNIPVQYARQMHGGHSFGGSTTHLPLRVNMAGVIPIIFAVSVVLFPSMIAQFFVTSKIAWLASASTWIIGIMQNQLIYGIIYFVFVVAFTYFYTEVVFHPEQVAENLQKQGGFIPGIRPGQQTSRYLANVTHKITLAGALFLGVIAILPLVMRSATGMQSLSIGGTSLLIVVSVVIESVKQIEAQMTMRQYDGY
ncbi:MAG TPA: preprotein translocase subunit SecY [bacterium]|nr:preprotein translocase subunit SecY [bacterium]